MQTKIGRTKEGTYKIGEGDDCYVALAHQIILFAVYDYADALKKLRKYPNDAMALGRAKEIERFFASNWAATLSDLDYEKLVIGIRKEYPDVQRPAFSVCNNEKKKDTPERPRQMLKIPTPTDASVYDGWLERYERKLFADRTGFPFA